MRYAIIENNVVVNVTESEEPVGVASEYANIGDVYDGSIFHSSHQPISEVVADSFFISKRAFIKRLTTDYWLDLEDAAASIRDLRKLVLLFNNSSYINLQDPDVVDGVSAALSPLMPVQLQKTQAEVDAILLTPCQPGEEP